MMTISQQPAITVLIATYNKSSALRYAIDSVLWQTFTDFECWVIGDGCTDDTAEVVTAYDDPRVKWYNLPQNTGDQSEPHNEGLRRAQGQYIAYLNHDDVWLPTHLQTLVTHIEKTGADFVFSILEWIIPGRDPYVLIPDYPVAPIPPEATATLHRKNVIDTIGYWRHPEETYSFPRADYFRRAQFSGKRFELVPALTALKFGISKKGYAELVQQPEYMAKIRTDPDFAHKELAPILARVQLEMENHVRPKRIAAQIVMTIKRSMAKRGIDPARIRFWQSRGKRIREWRRGHGLDK
ncbi:MAG: glycosyltransferase [Chloroflexi bacterium]|nr:glycosyltransferase [Chloroflexota bacterium]